MLKAALRRSRIVRLDLRKHVVHIVFLLPRETFLHLVQELSLKYSEIHLSNRFVINIVLRGYYEMQEFDISLCHTFIFIFF